MFDPKNRLLLVVATVAALVAFVGVQVAPSQKASGPGQAEAALAKTMNDVSQRWPKLAHVDTDSVAQKIGKDDLLLIDARSTDEFSVSHLKGAHHVAPNTTAEQFQSQFGDQIKGKDVVFYCAVGVRSSTLATRVGKVLKANGARSVSNLAGGIFAWHNEKRPLVDANGATQKVHTYDQWWGRMVERKDQARTSP